MPPPAPDLQASAAPAASTKQPAGVRRRRARPPKRCPADSSFAQLVRSGDAAAAACADYLVSGQAQLAAHSRSAAAAAASGPHALQPDTPPKAAPPRLVLSQPKQVLLLQRLGGAPASEQQGTLTGSGPSCGSGGLGPLSPPPPPAAPPPVPTLAEQQQLQELEMDLLRDAAWMAGGGEPQDEQAACAAWVSAAGRPCGMAGAAAPCMPLLPAVCLTCPRTADMPRPPLLLSHRRRHVRSCRAWRHACWARCPAYGCCRRALALCRSPLERCSYPCACRCHQCAACSRPCACWCTARSAAARCCSAASGWLRQKRARCTPTPTWPSPPGTASELGQRRGGAGAGG